MYNLSKNKFYSMRIGDNYFVPARRIEDAQIGVLNTYTGEFLTDVLNGDPFVAGPVVVQTTPTKNEDPFALTDYIESSGTQYIDTGYIVKDNSRFEIVCNIFKANLYPNPFGTRVGAYNNSCCVWFRANDSDTTTYIWSNENGRPAENNARWGGNTNRKIVLTAAQGGIQIMVDTFYNVGGLTNAYAATPVNPYPLFLFAMNSGGTVDSSTLATMKLYRFRIFEGNSLVMELLPAIDQDNVVCLKDTISGNYFYNQGTGDFVFGTDE